MRSGTVMIPNPNMILDVSVYLLDLKRRIKLSIRNTPINNNQYNTNIYEFKKDVNKT